MQPRRFVTRPISLLPWLLSIVCTGGAFAACNASVDGTPSGSSAGAAGSAASGNNGGGGSGVGGDLGLGGNLNMNVLTVMPPQATITITDKNTPVPFEFKAFVDGNPISTSVFWSLDSYAAGSISPAGQFATTGMVGGQVVVSAKYGSNTATALLTIKVAVTEQVITDPMDPGVSPPNQTALEGTPLPDPGALETPPNASKILYPYDKTVMPRGLVAPLLQFTPGSIVPEDAKITMTSSVFSWTGYVHVKTPGNPQLYVPQDVWDAAMQSAGGETLKIDVVKAAAGMAYGPAQTSVIVAPGSLKGAVYYMTYEAGATGLYSVRPGVKEQAKLLIAGCVVCHSVSANGTRLATGADDAAYAPYAGIYNVNDNGDATQLTTAPAGLGGDSRGLSFATFTPDGNYVMRSQNNFWGGVNQLAWRIDDATGQLVPATVTGLGAGVAALLPAISHDSKRYAFTNGPGEPVQFGTPSRSVSLMDLNIDAATDTLTFGNRQLLVDNGPTGPVTKFVTFMPDADHIVLQEGEGYNGGFDQMLPTWGSNSSYTTSTGRMHMIRASTGEHIELSTLNAGIADIDRQRNYEPFALPVTAGGYFWVVFTSIREYGNTYSGPTVRKQLWVAAISPNHAAGEDPSHPPFYLPNQTATANERGFWALTPCRAVGATCETGNDCCEGFCRPSDPENPSSPKVCNPPGQGCSQVGEKCTSTADCCEAAAGTTCIGGFCTPPIPN